MKKILVTSGIHGEERSGPMAAMKLVSLLEKHPKHFGNLDIDIFPILSPTGYCLRTREDYLGRNFNNWWTDEVNLEPLIVSVFRSFFNQRKYDMLISLHEHDVLSECYIYGTNVPRNSRLAEKLLARIALRDFGLYSGIDDPELGFEIVDGYCEIDPNSELATFEEWMSRTGRADKVLTFEIGGSNDIERRISLAWELLYLTLEEENNNKK